MTKSGGNDGNDEIRKGTAGAGERQAGTKNKPKNKKCRLKQIQTAFCLPYRI